MTLNEMKENYVPDVYANDNNYYLRCKSTGIFFQKWKRTKILTSHLNNKGLLGDYPKDSRGRHKYYALNATYWYMEYFTLVHKDDIDLNKVKKRKRNYSRKKVYSDEPTIEQLKNNYVSDVYANDDNYVLLCKTTDVIIKNWKNTISLKNHLDKYSIDYYIPTKHKDRQLMYYYKKKYWYSDLFDLKSIDEVDLPVKPKRKKNKFTDRFFLNKYVSDPYTNNNDYVLRCKVTSKIFKKWLRPVNLKNHLTNNNIKFDLPESKLDRAKLFYKTKGYWYTPHFDLIHISEVSENDNVSVSNLIPIEKDIYADDKLKGLKCNVTGEIFKKWTNTTSLTKHLINNNIPCDIPSSSYHVKKYFNDNKEYWYMQYFTLVDLEIDETKKCCPHCDHEYSTDISFEKWYVKHLKEVHGLSLEEHLKMYPDELKYFPKYEEEKYLKTNGVQCQLCGKHMRIISGIHLEKIHGIDILEYTKLFPSVKTVSNATRKLLQKSYYANEKYSKKTFRSKAEIEICDYLEHLGIEYIKNNRSIIKLELDIYIPSHNLAIEYNGNYFHSELYKDNKYHLNKTIDCENKGIQLIHIFSDEWRYKKQIVKNKIRNLLGIKNEVIYARKCGIKPIKSSTKNNFLNKFHLQGEDKSLYKYGAFYDNMLVAVMTFQDKGDYHILNRYVMDSGYAITGIFNKLLQHHIRNADVNEIISFADRRFSTRLKPNVYERNGFDFIKNTLYDYKYYHRNSVWKHKRFHKSNHSKKDMIRRFPNRGLNMTMTESQMNELLGFVKVYDCGLLKYKYTVK